MTFSRMTPQGSQWEVMWPRGPVWNADTQQKSQGKQPASTVVLGDNQESAQRCLPKTFYYSPTQNILGRNAVTNLDSILKSRDLTLPTKVHLVRAMVFPVVMYRCKKWSEVAQLFPTLCDPMNRSMPGLPVYHQLPEFTQTHVHRVSYAMQPSHPLSSPSPPAPNPSQHHSLFQWVNSSHEVAKVLEFQLQHQSFQRIFRTDFV